MHEIGRFYERRKNKLCLDGSCDLHYLGVRRHDADPSDHWSLVKSVKRTTTVPPTHLLRARLSSLVTSSLRLHNRSMCLRRSLNTHHMPQSIAFRIPLPAARMSYRLTDPLPSWVWLRLSDACVRRSILDGFGNCCS